MYCDGEDKAWHDLQERAQLTLAKVVDAQKKSKELVLNNNRRAPKFVTISTVPDDLITGEQQKKSLQ